MRNAESADLRAFFQARTVRPDGAPLFPAGSPSRKPAKAGANWRPAPTSPKRRGAAPCGGGDGRFDAAAAPLRVGIVLASAGVITGTAPLAWVAGALGAAGTAPSAATYAGLM